jgi:hypothetical protein
MIWTIWDLDSGNLVGTYDTEQEALAVLRSAIKAYGASYTDGLVLGREDSEGRPKALVEGQELARRALVSRAAG